MQLNVDTSSSTMPRPAENCFDPEKEFILGLETLPVLWDKTHAHYTNKYKRNEALEKLLQIFKKTKPTANIENVKKKINTLRSNYRREFKKIVTSRRSGAGADEIYVPKSWTFEYLRFLDKFEQPQPLHIDDENSDNSDENNSDRSQEQGTESQESSSQVSTSRSSGSISSINARMPPPPPSKKIKKDVLAKQTELLSRAFAYLAEPKRNLGNSIAFEWSDTLNRLDPTQRLYAKKAINDILFEAELGNLNRYSVQINPVQLPPVLSPSFSNNSVTTLQPPPNSLQYTAITPQPLPSYTSNTTITSPQSSSNNLQHTVAIPQPPPTYSSNT